MEKEEGGSAMDEDDQTESHWLKCCLIWISAGYRQNEAVAWNWRGKQRLQYMAECLRYTENPCVMITNEKISVEIKLKK